MGFPSYDIRLYKGNFITALRGLRISRLLVTICTFCRSIFHLIFQFVFSQRRRPGNRGSASRHKRKWSLGRMAGNAYGKPGRTDPRI